MDGVRLYICAARATATPFESGVWRTLVDGPVTGSVQTGFVVALKANRLSCALSALRVSLYMNIYMVLPPNNNRQQFCMGARRHLHELVPLPTEQNIELEAPPLGAVCGQDCQAFVYKI